MTDQDQPDVVLSARLDDLVREPLFRGSVDLLEGEFVQGWCIACDTLSDPMRLEVFVGACRLGTVVTTDHREDIATAVAYDVRAGFRFDLRTCPHSVVEAAIETVRECSAEGWPTLLAVRVANSHFRLPYSPSFVFGQNEASRVLTVLESIRAATAGAVPSRQVFGAVRPGVNGVSGRRGHVSDPEGNARRVRTSAARGLHPSVIGRKGGHRPPAWSQESHVPEIEPDQPQRSTALTLQTVAKEIRARINESAPLDSLLNEMARLEMLVTELNAGLRGLEAEMRLERAKQRMRDVLLPEAQAHYRGNQTARVDAGMPLSREAGFFALQYDDLGHPSRWTGPHPAFHFDLHLDRSVPLRFVLSLSADAGDDPGATRAFCDGAEVPVEVFDCDDRIELVGFLMPREALGLTRLYFRPSMMLPSVGTTGGGDDHLRGVVFQELSVELAGEGEVRVLLEGSKTTAWQHDDSLARIRDPLSDHPHLAR